MYAAPQDHPEDTELPVPLQWRVALKQIADALVDGQEPAGIAPLLCASVDRRSLEISRENIAGYPDPIGPLTEATWVTSICHRAADRRDLLIDLCCVDGSVSDLVRHARVRVDGGQYMLEVRLVYVP
jgi:hypothetical protein